MSTKLHAITSRSAKSSKAIITAPKSRLTHFLCIPLGHHAALRDTWANISSELLAASPHIPGLHTSILVPPRSLHLTLGVLSLVSEKERDQDSQIMSSSQAVQRHTVSEALHLLYSLREPIETLLRSMSQEHTPLTVPLELLDVMDADSERSHVLWVGPDTKTGAGARLVQLCDLVHTTFREAGMLKDSRALKLHCTLVNTVYRRPRGKRVPFSCVALRESAPYSLFTGGPKSEAGEERPWRVNLGTWVVDEVQLCEMGRMQDGTYHSVGKVELVW